MLDQNTDRMWYVIGAVIIGAAIILIMNKTFPQLFASVGATFTGKVDQTTEIVDGIMPNTKDKTYLTPKDLTWHAGSEMVYDQETRTFSMNIPVSTGWQSNGFSILPNNIEVPYGKSLMISYEIWIPSTVTGAVANTDVNNQTRRNYDTGSYDWSTNDNDDTVRRTHNGVVGANVSVPLLSGSWTTVVVTYTNTHVKNVNKESLYDTSGFGVNNKTGSPLPVKIRNVYVKVY